MNLNESKLAVEKSTGIYTRYQPHFMVDDIVIEIDQILFECSKYISTEEFAKNFEIVVD